MFKLRHRNKALPINCGDIKSQYFMAVVSPTTSTGLNVPMLVGRYVNSHYPTSQLSFLPTSIGCAKPTVNAPIQLSGY